MAIQVTSKELSDYSKNLVKIMDAQIKEVLFLASHEAGEASILSKKLSFSVEQQEKQKKVRGLWEDAEKKIGVLILNLKKFKHLSPYTEDDMRQWNQLHDLINKQFHEINRYSIAILRGLNFYSAKLTFLIRSNEQNKKPAPSTQQSPPLKTEEKKNGPSKRLLTDSVSVDF